MRVIPGGFDNGEFAKPWQCPGGVTVGLHPQRGEGGAASRMRGKGRVDVFRLPLSSPSAGLLLDLPLAHLSWRPEGWGPLGVEPGGQAPWVQSRGRKENQGLEGKQKPPSAFRHGCPIFSPLLPFIPFSFSPTNSETSLT